MSPLTAFVGLTLLAIVGLLISSSAHKRYTETLVKNRNVRALKVRALQIQEILESLARTNCRSDIRQALGECMVDSLRDIKDIDPNCPGIDVVMEVAQQLTHLPPKSLIEYSGPAESDHEIKSIQRMILAANAQVRKLPEGGRITRTDSLDWCSHLNMLYVQVEVDAHLLQGKQELDRGNKGAAAAHYRVALNKLSQSKFHGDSKKPEIQKINAIINSIFK